MRIFGRNWTAIHEEAVQELLSLERERAIYTDQWQEELEDFRHVQIRLSCDEIDEYVRGYWSYELFLRAGMPRRASNVPGIPPDIVKRADNYQLHTAEGPIPDPPHHCPAAFLGEDLEAIVCGMRPDRVRVLDQSGKEALKTTVKRAIDALTPAIRLFGSREEKSLDNWPITCEADIRDLLHVMLRASIADIIHEEVVPSRAGVSKRVDLYSEVARMFIEVKWINDSGRWKQILAQINDDIQTYPRHPLCEILYFVVVDVAKDIPDPELFQRDLSKSQTIDGKEIEVLVFVREP